MAGMANSGTKQTDCALNASRSLPIFGSTLLTFLLATMLMALGCDEAAKDPFALRSDDGSSDPFGGLGKEIEFEGYRFRPPGNLTRKKIADADPNVKAVEWAEPGAGSKLRTSIALCCAPIKIDLRNTAPPWEYNSQTLLGQLNLNLYHMKKVGSRRLQINGMEAYRTEFTATSPESKPIAGLVVFLATEQSILSVVALSVGENASAGLTKLDESIMTLQTPGYQASPDLLWDVPYGAPNGAPLTEELVKMVKTYGLDKIVCVAIHDGLGDDLAPALGEAAGPGAVSTGTHRYSSYYVHVAPVDDVEEYADKLDLGAITEVDVKKRFLTLEPGRENLPPKKEMAAAEPEAKPRRSQAPTNPKDLDFFKQNLAALQNGRRLDKEDSLRRLVNADTSKLNDPEMRNAIAKAIRDVAFDNSAMSNTRRLAIRGLVHWGGKFAGPVLVDLLRKEPAFIEDEIYKQLAILKEPSAIDLLVERLVESGGIQGKEVAQCLVAYGPAAEDSVLANTRAEDPMTTRLILQVLAEIGTKKSLPALQSLRNVIFANMIKDDLQRAVQMIEQREKGQ